ncbi:MAG: hypothetical protein ABFS86_18310 [Planctomycetota bacterium]
MRWILAICLLACSGCTYLGDRALDLVDPYRISVGAGSTVGVRACKLGLIDTGLMVGVKPNAAALGWRYGEPRFFNQQDTTFDADQAEIVKTSSIRRYDYATGDYRSATGSAAILPALFTWTDTTPTSYDWTISDGDDDYDDLNWLWEPGSFSDQRYSQVHAFDIELDIGLGVYLELGISPGEVVDFWLGWLLIDIAMDDGRLGGGD